MKCKSINMTMLLTAAGLLVGATALQAQSASTNVQSGSSSGSSAMSGMQSSDQSAILDARAQRIAQSPTLFIQTANQDNLTEIQAGQIAQQKGQSQQVKDYGKELAKDHQALNDKVLQLAKQKGIDCQNTLDTRHQMKVDRISAFTSDEFDKRFLDEQAKGHKQDVALFEQVASKCPDSDVKQFAQDSLPALRQHLQMAESQGSMIHEAAGAQGTNSQSQGQSTDQNQPQQYSPDSQRSTK